MASNTPWKDERWLPGVLNKEQMIALMEAHLLLNVDREKTIDNDASALDLHLSGDAYYMKQGSIKPFNKSYHEIINDSVYAEKLNKNEDTFLLEKEKCYIFKIKEALHPCIKASPIFGQATAKSTVGRIDVIARLIVDGMKEYEKFNPSEVVSGEMFLEITPINFNVKVKEGISISQLRFFYGEIEHSIINDRAFINSILNLRDDIPNDGTLSVDISNTIFHQSNNDVAAAFRGKEQITAPIELWGKDNYNPEDFWDIEKSTEINNLKSIVIERNKFYILRSRERISLPPGVCIYCRAMDETLGEMRIHYAGFVHPYFGLNRKDQKKGTPLIFEVRGHNVNVLLTQSEILARLYFYRMSMPATEGAANYNEQELNLSKFFKGWGKE